jgi:hypothetical protein
MAAERLCQAGNPIRTTGMRTMLFLMPALSSHNPTCLGCKIQKQLQMPPPSNSSTGGKGIVVAFSFCIPIKRNEQSVVSPRRKYPEKVIGKPDQTSQKGIQT